MLLGGIILDVMVWLDKIAQDEPPLVLHLSTAAIYTTGFGNLVLTLMNKYVRDD